MQVKSVAFEDGRIADKYGVKGGENGPGGMPLRSFPLEISGAPPGTGSFAVVLEDPDSAPNCGFTWIHWLVAGLKRPRLEEDASRTAKDLIQGATSWNGRGADLKQASAYGGPNPPDRPHTYHLHVYALDFEPALKPGFSYEELMHVAKGHILARAELTGVYGPA